MAFTGSAVCNSFKTEVLTAIHDFTASTGDTFKLSLYTNSASPTKSTTVYFTGDEVSESGTGYTAGGNSLTSVTPALSTDTACCDFSDTSWTSATITARGALIYNSTATPDNEQAVAVLDFGGDKTCTSGTFTIQFPTADASDAILRLA
jgi:hypothetical protein